MCPLAEFLAALTEAGLSHSVAGDDRLWRSHGHTMHEIFALRRGELPPLVDLVVWPGKFRIGLLLGYLGSSRKGNQF